MSRRGSVEDCMPASVRSAGGVTIYECTKCHESSHYPSKQYYDAAGNFKDAEWLAVYHRLQHQVNDHNFRVHIEPFQRAKRAAQAGPPDHRRAHQGTGVQTDIFDLLGVAS